MGGRKVKYQEGLVSVITPTYRTTKYLTRAIDSILNQTYKNIECILVNDNIPGDEYSLELYKIIQKYKNDSRFIFLEQPDHINGAVARNYGIKAAHGEYIAFLDDDDWWKIDKIEKQIDFIRKQNQSCGGVSTLVESYEKDIAVRWMRPYKDGKISKQILRREVDIVTGSFLAKHEALDDAGYFDPRLKRHQEVQLLTFFTDKYEIKLLKEYLTCYNLSSNNNMPNSEKLRKLKEDFFEAVSPVMNKFGKWEVKRIRALHKFELAYIEYKEKKFKNFLKDTFYILIDPITFSLAIKRVLQRQKEYKKPNIVLKGE